MQGVSSNLIVLGWKFSDVVPRASNAVRIFPTTFTLDFSQLLDSLGKRLKFHIKVQEGLKKLLNGFVRLIFSLAYYQIHFSSLQYKLLVLDVIIVFEIDWNP